MVTLIWPRNYFKPSLEMIKIVTASWTKCFLCLSFFSASALIRRNHGSPNFEKEKGKNECCNQICNLICHLMRISVSKVFPGLFAKGLEYSVSLTFDTSSKTVSEAKSKFNLTTSIWPLFCILYFHSNLKKSGLGVIG